MAWLVLLALFGLWLFGLRLLATTVLILILILVLVLVLLISARLLAFAMLAFLLFALGVNFALRHGKHSGVMLGVLLKVFGGNPVICQLRIPRQLHVFFNNLLGCSTNLAFGAGTVENPVGDISNRPIAVIVIVIL